MKKIFPNNFCLFSLLVSGIFSLPANAQIVYTDVNPDITYSGTYNLDLNNDGTIDFVIQHTSSTVIGKGSCKGQTGTNHYIKITPLNTNQVLDIGSNPKMLLTNDVIKATPQSSWSNQANQLMIGKEMKCTYACFFDWCGYMLLATATGQWLTPVEDGYLGLRLNFGGHSYFGWVRLSISHISFGAENFTIKDYAINATADQPIYAGQTSDDYIGVLPFPNVPGYFCAGNSTVVSYFISGQFATSNIVTAQLSDALGSFVNPVTIGSTISNVSGNINAVIPASTPSGGGYRIRVTSSNPVRISYPVVFPFQVNGLPIPSISSENGSNICRSGSINLVSDFDYNAPWAEACLSYQWRINGNDIPGANASSYLATSAGNYTCVKSNGAVSVTSNVIQIVADPFPPFIQVSPGSVVCGEPVYLNATGMSGTYQWKLNGNSILGATGITYNPTVSGNYTCVVTNACGSFASNSIPVSINPPMADATITAAGPTIACNGPVTLNANTGTGLSYHWYPHYDSIPATNSFYTPSTSGNYYVIETNSYGCTRQSNSISVIIGTPVTHTIYPSSGSICQGNPVYLYTDYYFQYYSYQWTKDGSDISGANNYYYTAKQPGTYAVRVSAPGGCSSVSAGVIITHSCNTIALSKPPTSNELENPALNEQKLTIAPNPASSQTQISFITPKSGKVLLNVFNIDGKLIKIITDRNFEAGTHQLLLDTKNFRSGIYILQMQTGPSTETKKLVVVK